MGLSEEEKARAVEIFKKKTATEILKSVQGRLPEEYQYWIAEHLSANTDQSDPKVLEIKNKIGELFSETELSDLSRAALKKLVFDYIEFMSDGLSSEKVDKLNEIYEGI